MYNSIAYQFEFEIADTHDGYTIINDNIIRREKLYPLDTVMFHGMTKEKADWIRFYYNRFRLSIDSVAFNMEEGYLYAGYLNFYRDNISELRLGGVIFEKTD